MIGSVSIHPPSTVAKKIIPTAVGGSGDIATVAGVWSVAFAATPGLSIMWILTIRTAVGGIQNISFGLGPGVPIPMFGFQNNGAVAPTVYPFLLEIAAGTRISLMTTLNANVSLTIFY